MDPVSPPLATTTEPTVEPVAPVPVTNDPANDESLLDLLAHTQRIDASHFRDDIPWRLKKAQTNGKCSFVLFYADWCGYCTRLKPDYDKFAEQQSIKQSCNVFAIDIDPSKTLLSHINEHEQAPLQLKSWPTIVIYLPNGRVYGTWSGERTVEALSKAADELVASTTQPRV